MERYKSFLRFSVFMRRKAFFILLLFFWHAKPGQLGQKNLRYIFFLTRCLNDGWEEKNLCYAILCAVASVGFVVPAGAEETMTHDLDEVIVEADRNTLPGDL